MQFSIRNLDMKANEKFQMQIKQEADEFKKQFRFIEKEKLFMELQQTKIDLNSMHEENVRLKTRLSQQEKELLSFERICEEMQNYIAGAKTKPFTETFIIQLRKQNKELTQEIKDKERQLEQLKKHSKVTKYQELEFDRKAYSDETMRMRKLLIEAAQKEQIMIGKYNQTVSLEAEVNKVLKINENLLSENTRQQNQIQQNEEMVKQLQQLYKANQVKCQTLEKQLNDSKEAIKKVNAEKNNLKQTIKQLQESQYTHAPITTLHKPVNTPVPKINAQLLEEIRYKLILRGISQQQLHEMLEGLKDQAKQQSVQVRAEDIQNILAHEPFLFTDQQKITSIIKSINGQGNTLVDNFRNMIGQYKTFADYPTFDFVATEQKLSAIIKGAKQKIQDYWKKHKVAKIQKQDIRKFLQVMQFNWDEPTLLFFYLNVNQNINQLFEKSNEDLSKIQVKDILDPFFVDQPQNHMRISEESDEELFDKQSQDYSLDENGAKQQNIVFRNEGHEEAPEFGVSDNQLATANPQQSQGQTSQENEEEHYHSEPQEYVNKHNEYEEEQALSKSDHDQQDYQQEEGHDSQEEQYRQEENNDEQEEEQHQDKPDEDAEEEHYQNEQYEEDKEHQEEEQEYLEDNFE